MKVFVVGSINMDLVISADHMPVNGETMQGSDFFTNPGGKGANQAVASAKLGANTYMVGCVGNSFGKLLKETLDKYGVDTTYVKELNDVSSGVAVIVVVDHDNRIILDGGANMAFDNSLIEKALNTSNKGDILICQNEIPQESIKYALSLAKEKELITIYNPAPAKKLIDGIINNVDYLIVNETEAEFYSGINPCDEDSIIACSNKLATLGVKNTIITLGSEGSCFIHDNKVEYVKAYKVKAVDTTAAGDTFIGAFASCLVAGKSILDSMDFAAKASSITVSRKGAQQSIPYKNEVIK